MQSIPNRLLRYTDSTVTEIADRLCFESASYFIRYFRKPAGRLYAAAIQGAGGISPEKRSVSPDL